MAHQHHTEAAHCAMGHRELSRPANTEKDDGEIEALR